MRFFTKCLLILLCLSVLSAHHKGEKSRGSVKLDPDTLYTSPDFKSEKFGPAKWTEFKEAYTLLENSEKVKGGQDIVAYNTKTGKRSVRVSAGELFVAGTEVPLKIEDYSWSSTGRYLLVFTNSKRVWRLNTRGDYWLYDLKKKKLRKLHKEGEKSVMMFAKFSPDSKYIAYVANGNIFIQSLADFSVRQLTNTGSGKIINGTFDWVYEEEFHMRDGFRWSPDSSKIAFWQFDTTGVRDFYMINNTDSLYPKIIPVQYPKAGQKNSKCRIGVVPVESGNVSWFKLAGQNEEHYLPRMEWAADSDEIVIQKMNRAQTELSLIMGDTRDMSTRTIIHEKDSAWIEVVDDLKWIKNGKFFTWVSEKDGWRHVYLFSRDGKNSRLITKGKYDVIDIAAIDQIRGRIFFTASPKDPACRYLCSVDIWSDKGMKKITPNAFTGTNTYTFSPSHRYAFWKFSDFTTPDTVSLIRVRDHRKIRTLKANSHLKKSVGKLLKGDSEFFRIKTESGAELDCWSMRPPDFDKTKKYSVLFFVYGEPWNQTVLNKWRASRYLWHLFLTQNGYIVMSVDNRGTPAPRGKEWRKSVYRRIGTLASLDQSQAVKEILRLRQWIDPKRVGIWGWSGGGSMTLNALFRYPEIYKMGMAVAPVSDLRYYDSVYQERYTGLLTENPEAYLKGSPITYAKNLKGKLLLVHGTGDDNVHYQCTEALINELVRHDKQFSLMSYPNRSHSIREGENTTRHLFKLLTAFLKKNL